MPVSQDFNVAFQELQPDLILSSVESLGYQTDGRLLALNSYENRVYRVGLEDEAPLVAKFYRPGRWDDDAILEEHEISIDLAEEEIPVVTPLLHEGRSLHRHGNFRFAVYPCRGGRAPDLDSMALQRQIGPSFPASISSAKRRRTGTARDWTSPLTARRRVTSCWKRALSPMN